MPSMNNRTPLPLIISVLVICAICILILVTGRKTGENYVLGYDEPNIATIEIVAFDSGTNLYMGTLVDLHICPGSDQSGESLEEEIRQQEYLFLDIHKCKPSMELENGEKVSVTFWTADYKNGVIRALHIATKKTMSDAAERHWTWEWEN